jgi:hypothetical protein
MGHPLQSAMNAGRTRSSADKVTVVRLQQLRSIAELFMILGSQARGPIRRRSLEEGGFHKTLAVNYNPSKQLDKLLNA